MNWTYIFIAMTLVGAIGSFLLTIKQYHDAKNDAEALKDQNLELLDEIELKTDELKKEHNINNNLTNEIIEISMGINENTESIKKLTNRISKITSKTNLVTEIIKNEQKQKGLIKLKKPNSDEFVLKMSTVSMSFPSEVFNQPFNVGKRLNTSGMNIFIKFNKNDVLVSLVLNDKNGNRIIEIIDGEWALNKSNNFSINYDERALEIIDIQGLVVFQVELIGNNFEFKGIYYSSNEVQIYNSDGLLMLAYDSEDFNRKFINNAWAIDRIFVHHGSNYLGKRMEKE